MTKPNSISTTLRGAGRLWSCIVCMGVATTVPASAAPPAADSAIGKVDPRREPPEAGARARALGSARPLPDASVRPWPSGTGPGHERLRQRLEQLRERFEQTRADRERVRGLVRDLDESLRRTDVKAEELREKLEAFAGARAERKRDRKASLHARWGRTLERPEAREELRLHGRRMARLSRLKHLTATERTGEKRKALLSRIDALTAKEQARHERVMKALEVSASTPGVASGVPSAPAQRLPAPSGRRDL